MSKPDLIERVWFKRLLAYGTAALVVVAALVLHHFGIGDGACG